MKPVTFITCQLTITGTLQHVDMIVCRHLHPCVMILICVCVSTLVYCTILINSAVMCHSDPLTAEIHCDVTVILARCQNHFETRRGLQNLPKKSRSINYCIYIAFQWNLTEKLLSHVGKGEGEPWWSSFQTKYLGNSLCIISLLH